MCNRSCWLTCNLCHYLGQGQRRNRKSEGHELIHDRAQQGMLSARLLLMSKRCCRKTCSSCKSLLAPEKTHLARDSSHKEIHPSKPKRSISDQQATSQQRLISQETHPGSETPCRRRFEQGSSTRERLIRPPPLAWPEKRERLKKKASSG